MLIFSLSIYTVGLKTLALIRIASHLREWKSMQLSKTNFDKELVNECFTDPPVQKNFILQLNPVYSRCAPC